MSEKFTIKRGDTSPTLVYTLSPAVSLVGASVVFNMQPISGATTIARASATIDDTTVGIVSYDFTALQTASAGTYHAEFEVTFADGSIETYPNGDNLVVSIIPDLG